MSVIRKVCESFRLTSTRYFFDSNSAVDGCSNRKEPGYEQMNWLRIQLEFLRHRGMKAILSGHVPPARNEAKYSWDETCWQKYALWMRQYRDVVVGSLYGHMNVDHFMLQDFEDIDLKVLDGVMTTESSAEIFNDRDMSILSTASYLEGLRKAWSTLPVAPSKMEKKNRGSKDSKKEEEAYYRKIGGEWGERYHVVHVSPSVVPNYFPTLRVFHYNTTGLDTEEQTAPFSLPETPLDDLEAEYLDIDDTPQPAWEDLDFTDQKKKRKKKKPKFITPRPPSKSSPPGPAYSPQALSWLGYTQYFANLTYINDDFNSTAVDPLTQLENFSLQPQGMWTAGKHRHKQPRNRVPHPQPFEYEVEYDTRNATDEFGMSGGFYVKEWLALAAKIGGFKPSSSNSVDPLDVGDEADAEARHRHKGSRRTWFTFIHRAFVGSKSMDELEDHFGHKD